MRRGELETTPMDCSAGARTSAHSMRLADPERSKGARHRDKAAPEDSTAQYVAWSMR